MHHKYCDWQGWGLCERGPKGHFWIWLYEDWIHCRVGRDVIQIYRQLRRRSFLSFHSPESLPNWLTLKRERRKSWLHFLSFWLPQVGSEKLRPRLQLQSESLFKSCDVMMRWSNQLIKKFGNFILQLSNSKYCKGLQANTINSNFSWSQSAFSICFTFTLIIVSQPSPTYYIGASSRGTGQSGLDLNLKRKISPETWLR